MAMMQTPVPAPAPCGPVDVRKMMRETSRQTSIDDLVRRGVRQVKVINAGKIDAMITEAVERAIGTAQVAALDAERGKIELEARQEFQALLQEHQEVVRSKEDLQRQKADLAAQLGQIEQRLSDERKRVVDGETFTLSDEGYETLDFNIRLLFSELVRDAREDGTGDEAVLGRLEGGLGRILDELLGDERRRRADLERLAQSRAIEVYERRIQKLNAALSGTEQRLREVAAAKGFDPGVASVFDCVQGLNLADADYQRKKGLLRLVFEENVALRKAG